MPGVVDGHWVPGLSEQRENGCERLVFAGAKVGQASFPYASLAQHDGIWRIPYP